jgi:hypothetical protein
MPTTGWANTSARATVYSSRKSVPNSVALKNWAWEGYQRGPGLIGNQSDVDNPLSGPSRCTAPRR